MCLTHDTAGSHPTCNGGTAFTARYDLYRAIPIEEVSGSGEDVAQLMYCGRQIAVIDDEIRLIAAR
jgi:hypothetical protein